MQTGEGAEGLLKYYYDVDGTRLAVESNGKVYYYKYNTTGDVISLMDEDFNDIAYYSYNAYGKPESVTDASGNDISQNSEHIANKNPFRYRGYYYDSETGLYYLQSRYYDPEIGRFINADGYVSTGQDINGSNMFSYCGNNPITRADTTGQFWEIIVGAIIIVGLVTTLSSCSSKPTPSRSSSIKSSKKNSSASSSSSSSSTTSSKAHVKKTYKSSSLKVCTDGIGSKHNDAYHQNTTAYKGGKINADLHRYIVIPTDYPDYANTLGCVGVVIDHSTGNYVYAIVGEGGPKGQYGEVSISVVWDLGYKSDGSYGPEGNFEFIIFPNTARNWDISNLNEEAKHVGQTLFR